MAVRSDPTEATQRDSAVEAQAEAALRTVRIVLAVLTCFVIAGYGPVAESASWSTVGLTVALIAVSTFLLNTVSRLLPSGVWWLALLQALDVGAAVALAVVLDAPLGHTSWALLVLPVVSASLRFGAGAALLSWVAGSATYVAMMLAGWVNEAADTSQVVRIPGTLLATAVTVGLMARWMREGWVVQNQLTEILAARENRLAVLETVARDLKNVSEQKAVEICAQAITGLGFDAATAHRLGRPEPMLALGNVELIAEYQPADDVGVGHAVVTIWTEDHQMRAQSAETRERHTGITFSGWSTEPVDQELAESLVALVALGSGAIEAARLVDQLRRAAASDPLTEVANRRTFDDALGRHARAAGRVAVAIIDLDHFKAVNDTYGHLAGDRVLVVVARRLSASVAESGLVARYGGDEFAVLLPDADRADAERHCRAMLDASRDPIAVGDRHFPVRLSIGVVVATTPTLPATLLAAADKATYEAKREGRDRVVVNEPEPLESASPG